MQAVRLLVTGDVQGVGFRSFVVRTASKLNISGYCANLPDGSVEVVAQGVELNTFIAQMMQGPALARVENCKVEDRAFDRELDGFEVR
jgi:acylphosphatase